MVSPSIEPLETPGSGGFTPCARLSAWAAAATDLTYSDLAVSTYFFFIQTIDIFRYLPNSRLVK